MSETLREPQGTSTNLKEAQGTSVTQPVNQDIQDNLIKNQLNQGRSIIKLKIRN